MTTQREQLRRVAGKITEYKQLEDEVKQFVLGELKICFQNKWLGEEDTKNLIDLTVDSTIIALCRLSQKTGGKDG